MNRSPRHRLTPLAALLAGALGLHAEANPIVIQPDVVTANDATIYEGFPTGNLSGGDNSALPPNIRQILDGFTGFLVVSQTVSGNDLQSLLSFDLSSLAGTDPADITDATVSVYAIDSTQLPFPTDKPTPSTAIDVSAYPVGDFSQTQVTWVNAPLPRDANNVPTATPYDTQTVDGFDRWVDFDLTQPLRDALATSAAVLNVALASADAVTDPTSGNDVSLVAYAGESSTFVPSPLQPKLTVNVVPEPAAFGALLVTGLVGCRRR